MKKLFDKLIERNHQSLFDVFISPHLGQNQTTNLKKLGYTFNDWNKHFSVPSNEQGNGWYDLEGFINGAFVFKFGQNSGGLFSSRDYSTSTFVSYKVFHQMRWATMNGGSRVYSGKMILNWIKQIDEKCVNKFNRSKSEEGRALNLGLILLSSILAHYYCSSPGGYQYNFRLCDDTFNLQDEGWKSHSCMKNIFLDFEQWKETGIVYRERDFKKGEGYSLLGYSGAQFALLKKRLEKLRLPEDISVDYILSEFRKQIKGNDMLYLFDMNTKYTTEYFK